jgi:hypothetical protein
MKKVVYAVQPADIRDGVAAGQACEAAIYLFECAQAVTFAEAAYDWLPQYIAPAYPILIYTDCNCRPLGC